MAKNCVQCGKELKDYEVYCSYCGAKQEEQTVVADMPRQYQQSQSEHPERQPVLTESLKRPGNSYPQGQNRYVQQGQQGYYPQAGMNPDPYGATVPQYPGAPAPKKKGKKGLIIGLIAIVLAVAVAAGAFFAFSGSRIKQNSPERLFDSTCDIAEDAMNSSEIFSEKELCAFYEYRFGDDSAKYLTKAYYNYIAAALCNVDTSANLRKEFGANITISYYIDDDTIVPTSEYSDLLAPGTSGAEIEEMHRFSLQVTVSGTSDTETEDMDLILVRAKGKWYYLGGRNFRNLGL